ncbi:MAG: tetratricopeptide repeat protein, partial [Planctomycetota bacterium]
AIEAYDNAIALNDENAWYFVNRGSAKHSMGDEDGAIADYDQSLRLDRRMADAYIGKSNVYLGRQDLENAMSFVNEALEAQPRNAMALGARGWIFYKMDNFEEAMQDYNQSIRYAPRMPVTYNNRGVCFAAVANFDRAITDYSRAIELVEYSPITYANRGTAYFTQGDFESAAEDFEKAVEMAPNLVEAMNSLAWFRCVCPDDQFRDGEAALATAKAACEATRWENWTAVDTYAAACAETGDFAEAKKWAAKAVELAPADRVPACRDRLNLYEQDTPFRSNEGKTSEPDQRDRRFPVPEDGDSEG